MSEIPQILSERELLAELSGVSVQGLALLNDDEVSALIAIATANEETVTSVTDFPTSDIIRQADHL
jgi:hypothetical protein